ncbi:Heterokaryon incompatibility protein (HET) domain containing protein [Hyaloscypha variabilis]
MISLIPGTQSDETFPYQPLVEDDSIRLVLLQPPSTDKSDELRCTLYHTTLSRCDDDIIDHYTALSYVWGDAKNVRTIWINNLQATITANLHSALRDLRDQERISRLWIDAISINQNNDEEKGKQVASMGKIYAAAWHTVIYLDPVGSLELEPQALLGTLVLSEEGTMSRPQSQSSANRLAVAKLILGKAWFRRVWVFQELIFSRDPWIQYRTHRWRWDRLYKFLEETNIFRSSGMITSLKNVIQTPDSSGGWLDENTLHGYTIISDMHLARERRLNRAGLDNQVLLLDLLQARRGLGATDSRDMIYALTGFASDGDTVSTDYTKSCKKLYEDFARFQMESSQDHSILSHVGDDKSPIRPKDLASWAPDWSSPKATCPFPHFADVNNKEIFWNGHVWINDSSVLACKGYRTDRVTHMSSPLLKREMPLQKHNEFSKRFTELQTDYEGGESEGGQYDIILRTRELCHDIHNFWSNLVNDEKLLEPIPVRNGRKLAPHGDFRKIFDTAFRRSPDKSGRSKAYEQYRLSHGVFSCTIDFLMHYFYPGCDKDFIEGRALARMESGKLALIPGHARVGDVAFRLRPEATENAYFLVRPTIEVRNSNPDLVFNEEALFKLKDAKHTGWSWSRTLQWLTDVTSDEYIFLPCKFLGDCWLDVAGRDAQLKGTIFAME